MCVFILNRFFVQNYMVNRIEYEFEDHKTVGWAHVYAVLGLHLYTTLYLHFAHLSSQYA